MTTVPATDEFVPEGMAYYVNPKTGPVVLPFRGTSIRFAVIGRGDLSSNAWVVWVKSGGESYVSPRGHMKHLKVSLHRSGKQHIAFTPESGLETTEGSRFWNQWWEPQCHKGAEVVPTFSLFFPSWALSLTRDVRDDNAKIWNKNQIFVEAPESAMATIVSFTITDADLRMRFSTIGESKSFPLGVLPVRPGKKLWVIAHHAPEGNMKQLAEQGIGGIGASIVEKLSGMPSGHVLGACVTGHTTGGGIYMMPFPARIHWAETDEVQAN